MGPPGAKRDIVYLLGAVVEEGLVPFRLENSGTLGSGTRTKGSTLRGGSGLAAGGGVGEGSDGWSWRWPPRKVPVQAAGSADFILPCLAACDHLCRKKNTALDFALLPQHCGL